ncbi:ABC transporter substrate-binding protein [Psychrobacter sp. I-STPA10]|uniref:ABC transporter substrate-binding protein n=1 Tax=Psychrobacter sp. I-STPA10 TaxID=2585769 RepID=UPI001E6255C1|nr:iron-siderophore ABC transporter substrate-binding protein [Psychrobacter sp. I-STPA10]
MQLANNVSHSTWSVYSMIKKIVYVFISIILSLISTTLSADSSTRIVHHALGVTVIEGKPKRIVSLFQGATDTLVALDIKPVGVVESWTQKPMYEYLRPSLEGVHYVGLETQPSLEDIALLQPDLIIATRFRNEKTYSLLSQIAPTVALEDVYDFRQTLKTVGEAVGEPEKANQILTQWNNRVAQTRSKLQAKFGQQDLPKVSLLEFRDDHVRAYSPNSFAGSILSDLGFDWSAATKNETWALKKLSSKESIPLIDANIFFVFLRDKPTTQQNYQAWTSHLLWKHTQADKTGDIYKVDSVSWNLAGGIISANHVLDDINKLFITDDRDNK